MKETSTAIMLLAMCAAVLLSAYGGVAMSASTSVAIQAAQTEKATKETRESVQEMPTPAGDAITTQIGFESITEEPIGKAVEKQAEPLAAENSGTMRLGLFLNNSLKSKDELTDQTITGESIITIADGAFYTDYGVPDPGVLCGSFFFDNWDKVQKPIDSDWYQTECGRLADRDLMVLAGNWVYSGYELMTRTRMITPVDVKGKKIRLANSQTYVEGFNALGATTVPMALGDVYTFLQNGTLDRVENPLSTLYGQSFQEASKNILMTGHILNFTTRRIGTDYLNTLTPEQQELLYKIDKETGPYNNEQRATTNDNYRKKLEEAGATSTELTDGGQALWKETSLSFYEKGNQFGRSDDLYDTVKAAM